MPLPSFLIGFSSNRFAARPAGQVRRSKRFRSWAPQLELLENRLVLTPLPVHDITSSMSYSTIQAAVNAANPGDTIRADAGTYNELVTVNKSLTLQGAQHGVDARTRSVPPTQESVVSNSEGDFVIQADNVTIDGFTLQGVTSDPSTDINSFGAAIYTNPGKYGSHGGEQLVNNIIQSNIAGIELNNDGTIQATVQYNLLQNNNQPGAGSGLNIEVDFGLSKALIDSNKFTNTSLVADSWALGVNTTSDHVTFSNNNVTNSGRGVFFIGTSNGTITNNVFTGASHYGIALFGNNGSPANSLFSISNNTLNENGTGGAAFVLLDDTSAGAYTGNLTLPGDTITTSGADLTFDNESATPIDATAESFNGLAASAANATQLFALEDTIIDAIDAPGFGLVRLKVGNVYVTQNSFFSPTTTAPSVQRGIDASSSGDVVNLQAGSYNGDVTLSRDTTLTNPVAGTQVFINGNLTQNGHNLTLGGPGEIFFGPPVNIPGDLTSNLTFTQPVGEITIGGNVTAGATISAPDIGDLLIGGNLLGKVKVTGSVDIVDVGGNAAAGSITVGNIEAIGLGGVSYGNGTVKSALNMGANDATNVLVPPSTTSPACGTFLAKIAPGAFQSLFFAGSSGFNSNKLLLSNEITPGSPVMASINVVQSSGTPVVPELDFTGDGGSVNTALFVTNIASTGKLGDVTLSAPQGIPGNITAPSIFGSIFSQLGPISGTIQTSGDLGMAMTDVHGNITGVTHVQATKTISGMIIAGGNLVSSVEAGINISGVIAAEGDLGVIQLAGGNAVVGPGPANLLTRFGGVNTGTFSGRAVVLGNVFGDITLSSLTGRIAVKGQQEFGLPSWRQGILGNVTINGALAKNAGIFSAGLIGDTGSNGLGNTTYGTHLKITGSLAGMVGAEGNINYGTLGTAKYAQFNGRGLVGTPSGATIDWIFTHGGNTPLTIPADLATLLDDLNSVFVSGGNLTHS